ncbi:MAG: Holliday junction resolvase RuvX [Burkholderiaceae bacterium]
MTADPDASPPARPAHPARTVLAFDFGTQRIGVAVGNSLSRDAQPLTIIAAEGDAERFARIGELIAEWRPAELVVGRPLHTDGADLPVTPRCDRFARQLQGRYGLSVTLVDERYSSVEAEGERRRAGVRPPRPKGGGKTSSRHRVDDQAAAIILRQYWVEQG